MLNEKSLFVLIVEHDSGAVRYFGPFDCPDRASEAGNLFAYENTPYTVSVTEMIEPYSSKWSSTIKNLLEN